MKKQISHFIYNIMIITLICGVADAQGASVQDASHQQPSTESDIRVVVPAVLSEAQVTQWMAQDPRWRLIVHQQSADTEAAKLQSISPYEWNLSYSQQTRRYSDPVAQPRSNEWSVELERSIRLPNKAMQDERIATAMNQASGAKAVQARQALMLQLFDDYLQWSLASSQRELMQAQVAFAEKNYAFMQKRFAAGDVAAMDVQLADANVKELQAQLFNADSQATQWQQLFQSCYAGLGVSVTNALPEPQALEPTLLWWQARILALDPSLQQAEAEWKTSQAQAEKASADRVPDPTLALFSSSESYGQERINGVRVSIPLPGSKRSTQYRKQLQEASVARDNRDMVRRDLNAQVAQEFHQAQSGFLRWQAAQTAAQVSQRNLQLWQKAFQLGEKDFTSLLQIQSQTVSSLEQEKTLRAQVLLAQLQLIVHAQGLWPQVQGMLVGAATPSTNSLISEK